MRPTRILAAALVLCLVSLTLTPATFAATPRPSWANGDNSGDGIGALGSIPHEAERLAEAQAGSTLPIERLAGPGRYDTAVRISQYAFPDGAAAVVIATGENFPDALAGAPLAASYDGPLLLVQKNAVPQVVHDEIVRLGANRVFILGSAAAVSDSVQQALAANGATVERIAGSDRYATAQAIAARVHSLNPTSSQVLIATGLNFPDALAASTIAAYAKLPILLVQKDFVPPATSQALASVGASKAYVVGSNQVISDRTMSAIGLDGERIAGATRYDTAVAIGEFGVAKFGMSSARPGLASGANFPDALGGGVALGRQGRVMLLTAPTRLSDPTSAYLGAARSNLVGITILGGEPAVASGVVGACLRVFAGLPAYEPEPVPQPQPQLTMAQQQAVKSARSYLDFLAFSRQGLIDQLIYEKFSQADAEFAVDYIAPDWNEQAVKCAQSYLDNIGGFSRDGLINQLVFEGFTQAQAEYGANAVGY